MPTFTGRPSRYDGLQRWLAALPTEQQEASLTFAEIETIIGGALPATAGSTAFWAGSFVSKQYWRSAGFAARLHRRPPTVEFRRLAA